MGTFEGRSAGTLAGVDLAWQSKKNPTAICFGRLSSDTLDVTDIIPSVYGIEVVTDILLQEVHLQGLAIDAPLVIDNATGQRECERAISREYGARKAGCHTSNTTLYPAAASVQLSQALEKNGFDHLVGSRWQIECYPHPALIELFGLQERLLYKKGRVAQKKNGQIQLARMIRSLAQSEILKLTIADRFSSYVDEQHIEKLSGQSLKSNEDALDALICLYIAGLYAIRAHGAVFGSADTGYIWVPQARCSQSSFTLNSELSAPQWERVNSTG